MYKAHPIEMTDEVDNKFDYWNFVEPKLQWQTKKYPNWWTCEYQKEKQCKF